jgi:hypothetical protein
MVGVSMALHVECYAGYKADERPLRFTPVAAAHPAGRHRAAARTYEVREVIDQWYGPGTHSFKVLADDGNLYILRHDKREDDWTLDSFRVGKGM